MMKTLIALLLILVFCTASNQSEHNGFNIFVFNSTALASADTLNSLKEIASLGSKWVGVSTVIAQDNSTSNQVYFDNRMPTIEVLTTFVKHAHRHKLRVLLKTLILCGENCIFINIMPNNITKWFASYGELMQNLSNIAESLHIEALSVGVELMLISGSEYTSYWRTLIENIRTGGYSGLLTYCSIFYPIETSRILFWDVLDFIGMDLYLPLLNITNQTIIPSQQDIVHRFSSYFQFLKQWHDSQPVNISSKKVILTEIGYPSSLSGLVAPSANLPDQCIGNYSANFTLQKMAFKGLFQALKENNGIIDGTMIFWWDNPSTPDSYSERHSNVWPCSWSPRGKPAERIIANAFCRKHRFHDNNQR